MTTFTYISVDGSTVEIKTSTFRQAIDNADMLNAMYRKQHEAGVFDRTALESKVIQYVKGAKSTFCMF